MKSTYPRIWRPFTVQKGAVEPLMVSKGEGLWLELSDKRRVMDLISSWWVNLHGHAHPHIAQAIARQASRLEHVIFAGFTHEPAEELAERLLLHTGGQFQHVFFSDNGSTAVEVALKIARQYWTNLGKPAKQRFLAFEGAYHGDTVGAMSAGDRSAFTAVFDDWLMPFYRVGYPATWIGDPDVDQKESVILAQVQTLLQEFPGEFAGMIMEPLVQGAGGMRMCRPLFLQNLAQILHEHGVLVIADEIMTGFGRTGNWFAYQRAGIKPDLICLSKGLTGGFLPMALTLTTSAVFEPFFATEPEKTLWHGHSYTGNALGCAAANASLDLMEQAASVFGEMEFWHLEEMSRWGDLKIVEQPRVCGTIAAFTLNVGSTPGYFNAISGTLKKAFLDRGMLVRPLGNVLYFMPPYCITRAELQEVYQQTEQILSGLSPKD